MEPPAFTHARVRALLEEHPQARPMLWGTLAETPPAEVMTFVSQGRRSGLLLWRGPDGLERALACAEGEVVRAVSGEPAEQDEARALVLSLLRGKEGTFSFLADRTLSAAQAGNAGHGSLSLQELLLDGLRRLDEERRLAG